MTSPTELNPAASVPPLTYTPYPNVLNPIDEPPSGKKRSSESFPAPTTLQQRTYAYEAPPPSQYPSASPQSPGAHYNHASKPFYLPPMQTAADEPGVSGDSPFLASSGLDQTIFPGTVVTSFDERNLWAGPIFEGASFPAQ